MPQTWAPTPCPKQNEDCLNSIGIMCFITYLIQIKTKNFYDMIDLILFIYTFSFYLNMEHVIIILTCLATWRSIWPAATAFTAFWAYAPLQYRSRLLLRSEFLWWPVRASEKKSNFSSNISMKSNLRNHIIILFHIWNTPVIFRTYHLRFVGLAS